jgi:hypothetical protein
VKPSHQIDLAYLYYLPFCTVFTSKDRFHSEIVPLFLSPFQSFVNGIELKEEMKKLDEHYSRLPHDVLRRGLMTYAKEPPEDTSFLTTKLWDKYLPNWRKEAARERLSKDLRDALLKLAKKFEEQSTPLDSGTPYTLKEMGYMTIQKKVCARKGKWRRFSEEVEDSAKENERK